MDHVGERAENKPRLTELGRRELARAFGAVLAKRYPGTRWTHTPTADHFEPVRPVDRAQS